VGSESEEAQPLSENQQKTESNEDDSEGESAADLNSDLEDDDG
jgi:hypothetical protein